MSESAEKVFSPIEASVLEVFQKLRNHQTIGKSMKKKVEFVSVFEIRTHNTKCVIIYMKAYKLAALRKALPVLKAETERMLGKQVYFIGYRRIIPKPPKRSAAAKVHRPYRRTVTAVHQSILEDLVFPSEIVGKRTLYRPKTGPLLKVFLKSSNRSEVESRKTILSELYKRITRRDVTFDFPLYEDPSSIMKKEFEKRKVNA